ncbi:acyl carrier protein [Streptomyces echinoruber]|uniref:Acyl carrier protein n=1 Tax=Streptomyces echinoruber TaxID=68898 RepID=A0A918R4W8_9ACTN|nr:acyl carrier protein [Streptomyces echinoruber]GGZ82118.1 putative acyl carrier protein [Streptomyces echinoruber]
MTDQVSDVTNEVTLEELAALMKRVAGVNVDPARLREQADAGFDTFGLESLGLLGIVAELEQRYGRALPEQTERCKTPAEFLSQVNGALRKGA